MPQRLGILIGKFLAVAIVAVLMGFLAYRVAQYIGLHEDYPYVLAGAIGTVSIHGMRTLLFSRRRAR